MQVGCFGNLVFSVNSKKVFTLEGIQGSTGSEWATHNTTGGKPKSEKTGEKLMSYKFTVTLDAQFGVKPREMLTTIQQPRTARLITSSSEMNRSGCACSS